jgi:hypothetical protein
MLSQEPATQAQYVGAAFDPATGNPYVAPDSRDDFLEGTAGTVEYSERPGVPNALDLQSDGVAAVDRDISLGSPVGVGQGAESVDGGWLTPAGSVWYDSERNNAGYPLPVPVDTGIASQFVPANDFAAVTANYSFPIDDYVRFTQPLLNPDDRRITERTFDTPTPWKANPTFPAQIQTPRPWDKVMGAWPWTGTKDAISQPVVSPPVYYPQALPDGIPNSTGAQFAMVPNTPSLAASPMTFRVIPEQWDSDYVYSGT